MEEVIRNTQAKPLWAYLNPFAMVENLWENRELAWQFGKRDIESRYKQARLGLLWSVIKPLVLLVIYTFAFAVVFKARWGLDEDYTHGKTALSIFCGLIVFNLFTEAVGRAPQMIVGNPNYVKKVVFPLEVFAVSVIFSSVVNMLIGFATWTIGFVIIIKSAPPLTMLWLPLLLIPVCLATVGVSWILASLGVFLRDVGHAVELGIHMLFFMTPIFYSIHNIGEKYQPIIRLNPLTHVIEGVRII
ncbi:MAG: ABC transporter permease, partial [Planctomycetota bacterium]